MSKYLCADCVLREQCDCEWTMRCASYVPKEYKQTNEEWIKQCNTEQLAEELTKVVLDLVSWNNDPKPSEVRNILKAWLKQPHANKE